MKGSDRLYTMSRVTSPTLVRACAAIALAISVWTAVPSAHKTVVSRYTFHHDVLPILKARCAACHADGAVAFPLATYPQVKSASWQIQQALVSGRMPVWDAEPLAVPFEGSRAMSAKELDILMTWAAGSAPEGAPVAVPVPHATPAALSATTTLDMPEPFTLAADRREADNEVAWPADQLAGQWIKAADVVPGDPRVVRRASVMIRSGAGDQVVSLWIPGDEPQALSGGGAFQVPPGAVIVLSIHYQQPSENPITTTDRSRVRLYAASPATAHAVRSITIEGAGDWPYGATRVFTQVFDAPVRIAALRPVSGPIDSRAALALIGPDGRRVPLARLVLRPEWPRRYVFDRPIAVAAGSRIEAAVTASYGVAWATLTDDRGVGPIEGSIFRLVLESIR